MCIHRWFVARFYDRMIRGSEEAGVAGWRRDLLASAEGEVLEIGAGTGLNLRHYPDRVSHLTLTEPEPFMARRLRHKLPADRERRAGHAAPEVLECSALELPLPDSSIDCAVSTLVLCSVPAIAPVLAELRRVLRPGGRLLFLEHIASDDPRILRRQQRIEPFWNWFACGCCLTRETVRELGAAGFEVKELREESIPRAPGFVARSVRGVAVSGPAEVSGARGRAVLSL